MFTLISILDTGIGTVSCFNVPLFNEIPLYLWWVLMTTLRVLYILCEIVWCPYSDSAPPSQVFTEQDQSEQDPSEQDPRIQRETVTSESAVTSTDHCSICLEHYVIGQEFTSLSPTCSHIFHSDCLVQWFKIKTTCPLCRENYV